MTRDDSMRGEEAFGTRNEQRLRALDLHDETGQILTAVLINLQHLERLEELNQIKDTVRDTQDLIQLLFHSIRSYLNGGEPKSRNHQSPPPEIVPALMRLTGDFSRRTGIEVRLDAGRDPERIPKEHKAVIYRVVQESLTNVFKHSGASRVTVRCDRTGERIHLEIEDDGLRGRGTIRPTVGRSYDGNGIGGAGGGRGLEGMRERIRLIGGDFQARLVQGRGMSIIVDLPYNIS